jgi:putative two-component system response regulator
MSAFEDLSLAGSKILLVDDTPANLSLLANLLKNKGFNIRAVPNGKLALKIVDIEPPDLILLDINMPEMSGYDVCKKLKADRRFSDIPIIFISALSETIDKVEAFANGGVDYITKPFQFDEVEARVRTHIKLRRYQESLEELVKQQVKEISDSQISTIFALSKLAESRDKDTGKHLERVQIFCRLLAEKISHEIPYKSMIGSDFIHDISNASPLHDIGKVAISDDILLKPNKLTPVEYEEMKTHTQIGAETLDNVKELYPGNSFINMGILIARSHHEHWDGSGYPDHLSGESIPLPARIMAIVDVYDAIRSKRCYKEPMSREQSLELITQESGQQFDPFLVKVFLEEEKEINTIGLDMGFL